ncbi:NADH:ubiquinone oxidoreductase 6.6kD subunit [Xylariaceae sp. FL0662B]|nr:NADH:ubiquinone oxidoreductase 6.6kD subunit [Xylariaceae sp. FL0662B]
MAGLQHYKMSMDPAIQKLGNMTSNRHKFFRWTPRTARIAFMYMVFVPAVSIFVAYQTDGRIDIRAKRRGDSMLEY